MRVLVFAAMVWVNGVIGMESEASNYEKHFQLNPSSEFEHYRTHAQELSFIHTSNNPLTTAVAIGNCEYCLRSAIEKHNQPSCGGCWRAFKCWWFNKIDEDVVHAAWHLASHKGNQASGTTYFQREKLLKHFPYVTKVVRAGRPILFHAVRCMNKDMVHDLLAYRADPNQKSNGEVVYAGHTPLMLAVHMEDGGDFKTKRAIVQRLVQYGANVNVRREVTRDTALLLTRETEILSLLIDKGAYVDDKAKDGKTIFDSEIFTSNNTDSKAFPELIKKILVNGALRPSVDLSEAELKQRAHYEFLFKELLKKFQDIGLPRDIQIKIFRNAALPMRFCTASTISLMGDRIDSVQCRYVASRVDERVLLAIAKKLPAEQRSIFAKRLVPELVRWRLIKVRELVASKPVHDCVRRTYFEFIQEHVPEYRNYYCNVICGRYPDGTRVSYSADDPPDRPRIWPPHSLEADIREYYKEMFGDGNL